MTKTRDLANLIADSKVGPSEIDTAGNYTMNNLTSTGRIVGVDLDLYANTDGNNSLRFYDDDDLLTGGIYPWSGRLNISSYNSQDIALSPAANVNITSGNLEVGGTTVIDSARRVYAINLQNTNPISFLNGSDGTSGTGAQGINVRHVYAGITYADSTAGAGDIEAKNSFKLAGTTVIDSSRNFSAAKVTASGSNNEPAAFISTGAFVRPRISTQGYSGTPETSLHFQQYSSASDTRNYYMGIYAPNNANPYMYFDNRTGGSHKWQHNGSTRMELDSSGNLLIGTTVSNQFGNTDTADQGISLGNGPWVSLSRNNPMFYGNRLSSNGDIFQFGYSGGLVGSLGTEGSDSIYLQGGTTGGAGLLFHGSAAKILPVRNGASVDATVDLGQASRKFKSIYAAGPLSNTYDFSTSLSRTYSGTDSYTPGSGDFIQLHNDSAAASATRYASIWAELPQYTGSSGSTRPVRFGGMSVDRAYSADFFVQTRGTNAQLTTRMTVGEEGVMREYTYNTSSNYKWWTPTSGDYQVREYDFGNRLYIKKDTSSSGYAQVVWLNRYLPAEFDMTFELKGGQSSSTYRHFGIVLNGNGVANTSQWDYIVLRQHSSNSALNTIRWDDAGVTRNSVEGSSNPNFFDGNKRRVRIEKRSTSLRCEIASLGQSPYVWGTHTGLGFTATEGGFTGFSIYEPGASDTWVEIGNLTITEV